MDNLQDQTSRWLSLPWDGIAIHINEIALKGGNKKHFIDRLNRNLRQITKPWNGKVIAYHDRLLIEAETDSIPYIARAAACLFGVSSVNPVRLLPPDYEIMKTYALEVYQKIALPGDSFAMRVKRADKRFPLSSQHMARDTGGFIARQTNAPVHLTNPDVLLSFRVQAKNIYHEGPCIPGPNGLPVGTSGRLLTLFSGGIDSPVAAWMGMRRGCTTDFIHFHTYADPEQVMATKIPELIRLVIRPQGVCARLLLVPYTVFEDMMFSADIPQQYELVMFRRFMVRTSCAVARRHRYSALVTGDNLGQVASQTMGNLVAFDQVATIPVFRPLVMANKQEIVTRAKEIGTFDASVEPYKDCCSLVATGPQTNPRMKHIYEIEEPIDMDRVIKAAVDAITTITLE